MATTRPQLSSLSSCSFVLMLQVSQAHNNKELNSSLLCFFCSNVLNPKDMMTKGSSCFFYSNVRGPHGQDDEKLKA
jgi:hypothetical protein